MMPNEYPDHEKITSDVVHGQDFVPKQILALVWERANKIVHERQCLLTVHIWQEAVRETLEEIFNTPEKREQFAEQAAQFCKLLPRRRTVLLRELVNAPLKEEQLGTGRQLT